MQIEFYDKYIDPTGKNILTPDALGQYLGIPALIVTVPEFRPGETFEMPVATAGIVFSYAKIIYGGLPRYYFVSEADPADLDSNIINLRFSMDWAHTLHIGQPVRAFMPQSVLTRSTLFSTASYAFDSDRGVFKGANAIGNTGSSSGLRVVAVFATKRTESIFTNPEYSYIGVGSATVFPTFTDALITVRALAGSTTYHADGGSGQCSAVAFYVIPTRYVPGFSASTSTVYTFDVDGSATVTMYRPNYAVQYSVAISVAVDPKNYAYEIGNGSNRVAIHTPANSVSVRTNFVLCGMPGEFAFTADVEGTHIDLTQSCAIPFVAANENEIGVQVNRRNLALVGAGVSFASGLASQNAALVYSGTMSAVSSLSDMSSTSFPQIVGSGTLYSDALIAGQVDQLFLFTYNLTAAARWRNANLGAVTMYPLTGFPVFGSEFEYVEGDLYPIPRNYFESLNIARMHDIFSDGVRIYTSASAYSAVG